MVTRYVNFKEIGAGTGLNPAALEKLVRKIDKGITQTEIFSENSSGRVDGLLIIHGDNYNFIDVLSEITRAGYAITSDRRVEQK